MLSLFLVATFCSFFCVAVCVHFVSLRRMVVVGDLE